MKRAEKQQKQQRDRTGKTVRVLSVELTGVEGVEGAAPGSSTDLRSVLSSIRSMGMCLAEAKRVSFEFLNRQDPSWAIRLPESVREQIGIADEVRKYVDEEGKTKKTTVFTFEEDDIAPQTAVYRIVSWMCPCLPSPVLDSVSQAVTADYKAWRKRRLEHPEDQQSLVVYRPPAPLDFRSRAVKIGKNGDRQMTVSVPVRTGKICLYAQEHPEARCLCHKGGGVDREGKERQPFTPFRGIEGKDPARVVFRCFVAGKRRRKAYQAFENILKGAYEPRDLRITLQGSEGRKQCWVARLAYEMPVPAKPEGISAAAVFSFTHLIYGITEDGSAYSREYGEGLRRQYKQFRAMARRVGLERQKEPSIKDLLVKGQEHFRDLGHDLRCASQHARPGAPDGRKGRLRDVRAIQGKQKRWTDWLLQQVGINFVSWLKSRGVADLYLLKWNLQASSLPADQQQKIVEFPRFRLAQVITQLCQEAGVEVHPVDSIASGEKKTKKGARRDALLPCPCCQTQLERRADGRCRCESIQTDEAPCGFLVWFDEWRGLNVLLQNDVDTSKAIKGLTDMREAIRKAMKKDRKAA